MRDPVRAILLVDHGSRREGSNTLLEAVAEALRRRSGVPVRTAHLELVPPSIGDAIDACAAEGVSELVLLPWFLGPGRHTTRDIPEQAAAAAARHPALRLRIAEPIGLHDKLVDVLLERAGEARDA